MSGFQPELTSFPESVGMNPILSLALWQSSNFPAGAVEGDVKVFDEQRNLTPGDHCAVAKTNSRANDDMVVVEILAPDQHTERFPDWEERLMRSFVLTRWKSDEDPEGGLGWFDMSRMIPITSEQYQELAGMMDTQNMGEGPPDWLNMAFAEYLEKLAELAPDQVAKLVRCPQCQGTDVEIHAIKISRLCGIAATKQVDGKTLYGLSQPPEVRSEIETHLHCPDCKAKGILSEDEWSFNEGTL